MALQKTIQLTGESTIKVNNLVFSKPDDSIIFDAYIKVECVSATKQTISAAVSFDSGDYKYERIYAFDTVLDGDNFIKQAYEYLKTLPEFADATDC